MEHYKEKQTRMRMISKNEAKVTAPITELNKNPFIRKKGTNAKKRENKIKNMVL